MNLKFKYNLRIKIIKFEDEIILFKNNYRLNYNFVICL